MRPLELADNHRCFSNFRHLSTKRSVELRYIGFIVALQCASAHSETLTVSRGRILIYADIVQWSEWQNLECALGSFANNYAGIEPFIQKLTESGGYRLQSTTLQPPHGLWAVNEILTNRDHKFEVVLLGAPEISFPDLTIKTTSEGIRVALEPTSDSLEGLKISISALPSNLGRINAISPKGTTVIEGPLELQFAKSTSSHTWFVAMCSYIVTGLSIETVLGPNWVSPSKEDMAITFIPEAEWSPFSPRDKLQNELSTDEIASFNAEWHRIEGRLHKECERYFASLNIKNPHWRDKLSMVPLAHGDHFATFGLDSPLDISSTTETDGEKAVRRRLLMEVVFYRPSRRIVSVYATLSSSY